MFLDYVDHQISQGSQPQREQFESFSRLEAGAAFVCKNLQHIRPIFVSVGFRIQVKQSGIDTP
jgi:hypothetical protein